ncbi:MAG: hypothetical protein KDN20_13805 [Verrucomicrobiae bacterium]|nr:hypothetical protein [Verrucomicrobiae bacterium]
MGPRDGVGTGGRVDGMNLLSPASLRNRQHCSLAPIQSQSYSLALRPRAFLNQLLHFDHPKLVIRNRGFALCRETEFGVFFSEEENYADPVSGLRIRPDQIRGIFFHQQAGAPPTFELLFEDAGFVCAIHPSNAQNSRNTIEHILRSFPCRAVDGERLRAAGAAAWLDEHLEMGSDSPDAWSEISQINDSSGFRLSTGRAGFAFEGCFQPWVADRDGAVVRLSDRGQQTVVFANLLDGSVSLPMKMKRAYL